MVEQWEQKLPATDVPMFDGKISTASEVIIVSHATPRLEINEFTKGRFVFLLLTRGL